MFTGIITGRGRLAKIKWELNRLTYAVMFPDDLLEGLVPGASVSIDGACQTVTQIEGNLVWFDAIQETLDKTTLSLLREGDLVNLERAAKMGDELGGHLLSGHVFGTVLLAHVQENIYILHYPEHIDRYLFEKGFVAIDGISLTIASLNREKNCFSIHLIPETLKRTTLALKKPGSRINLEIDSMTQAVVETTERVLKERELAFST